MIVTGKGRALTTETEGTESALADGTSRLQYVYLSTGISSDNEEGSILYTQDMFLEDGTNKVDQTFNLTGNVIGTIDGGIDPTTVNSFFSSANFIGAVSASDHWMEGWTK